MGFELGSLDEIAVNLIELRATEITLEVELAPSPLVVLTMADPGDHDAPILVITMARSRCSRCADPGFHDRPAHASRFRETATLPEHSKCDGKLGVQVVVEGPTWKVSLPELLDSLTR